MVPLPSARPLRAPGAPSLTPAGSGVFGLVDRPEARFEPSGVAHLGKGRVLVVNDKPDAPRLTVWGELDGRPARPFELDLDLDYRKLEDVTASRKHPGWALAVTSFETHPDERNDRLLQVFVNPDRGSSFGRQVPLYDPKAFLREQFGAARGYAKVEALALSPDERTLVVGLRSTGPDHAGAKRGVTLLAYDAARTDAAPQLIADVDLEPMLGRAEGISALEYAPRLGAWLLTTSYEGPGDRAEDVGGHLWAVPGGLGMLTRPERWAGLERHRFGHKPEGVTELDDGRVLVVFDDDDDRKDPSDPHKLPLRRNQAWFELLGPSGPFDTLRRTPE